MTVALEAKNTSIDELLEHTAGGDQVQLLQDGRAVALVSPSASSSELPKRTPEQIARAEAALADIDELKKRRGLKWDYDEFKADKEFGRR